MTSFEPPEAIEALARTPLALTTGFSKKIQKSNILEVEDLDFNADMASHIIITTMSEFSYHFPHNLQLLLMHEVEFPHYFSSQNLPYIFPTFPNIAY